MKAFFPSPERRRRFFALCNLVPALVLGGGSSMLPVRWWPLDTLCGAAVVLLLVTSAIALFDARRADRALVWAAAGLLTVGLLVVGAFALSVAFLSGVHGPFGAFGVALMGRPEIYFQSRPGAIDDDNNVTDERVRTNLNIWVERFTDWIGRFATPQRAVEEIERKTA